MVRLEQVTKGFEDVVTDRVSPGREVRPVLTSPVPIRLRQDHRPGRDRGFPGPAGGTTRVVGGDVAGAGGALAGVRLDDGWAVSAPTFGLDRGRGPVRVGVGPQRLRLSPEVEPAPPGRNACSHWVGEEA